MEPPVFRVLLPRLLLIAVPFAIWFVWREVARRTGRPMGATPWAWLFAGGALLVAASLMATVVFQPDNRRETYVPAEAGADGKVSRGHFEQR
jgi:drug/metabolite transporter (DMT)-like permease